ncbi:MAG: hypothetical protein OWT27_08805, partial [Firmicutes bacterium]|nr:hypothetical protein [Bacillota bacterium]
NISFVGAIAYCMGSETLSISSQGLWQQGPAELWIISFLWGVLFIEDKRRSGPLLAGCSLGMLALTRPEDVVLLIPFAIWIFRRGYRSRVVAALLYSLPFIAIALLYNSLIFGGPFSTGYGNAVSFFGFPLGEGLLGNLFSPSKGLFVFMPWTFFSFSLAFKISHLTREKRFFYLPLLMALPLYLVFYSKYYQWPAGYCFGPRYMADLSPYMAILACACVDVLLTSDATWAKLLVTLGFSLSLLWSVSIQIIGTYAPTTAGAWNSASHPNTFLRPLWSIGGSEIAFYVQSTASSFTQLPRIRHPSAEIKNLRIFTKPFLYEPGHRAAFKTNTVYSGTAYILNTGSQTWSAFPGSAGSRVVHFAYTVWKDGKEVIPNGDRSALLHSVAPGKGIEVYFNFNTPSKPGDYTYIFTLVQEGVAWFESSDSARNAYRVNLDVS